MRAVKRQESLRPSWFRRPVCLWFTYLYSIVDCDFLLGKSQWVTKTVVLLDWCSDISHAWNVGFHGVRYKICSLIYNIYVVFCGKIAPLCPGAIPCYLAILTYNSRTGCQVVRLRTTLRIVSMFFVLTSKYSSVMCGSHVARRDVIRVANKINDN